MKITAMPVGCMPRGRYGSRIGLIRRTEINLGSFDSLFLFNLFLAGDWIIYSLHSSFFNSFPPPQRNSFFRNVTVCKDRVLYLVDADQCFKLVRTFVLRICLLLICSSPSNYFNNHIVPGFLCCLWYIKTLIYWLFRQ